MENEKVIDGLNMKITREATQEDKSGMVKVSIEVDSRDTEEWMVRASKQCVDEGILHAQEIEIEDEKMSLLLDVEESKLDSLIGIIQQEKEKVTSKGAKNEEQLIAEMNIRTAAEGLKGDKIENMNVKYDMEKKTVSVIVNDEIIIDGKEEKEAIDDLIEFKKNKEYFGEYNNTGLPNQEKIPKEDAERAAEAYCEGRESLKQVLMTCIQNEIRTMACCAGHNEKDKSYISFLLDDNTKEPVMKLFSELNEKNRDDVYMTFINFLDTDLEGANLMINNFKDTDKMYGKIDEILGRIIEGQNIEISPDIQQMYSEYQESNRESEKEIKATERKNRIQHFCEGVSEMTLDKIYRTKALLMREIEKCKLPEKSKQEITTEMTK